MRVYFNNRADKSYYNNNVRYISDLSTTDLLFYSVLYMLFTLSKAYVDPSL